VWEQLSQPEDFLNHLCAKAGMAQDAWKDGDLKVFTYQVQKFEE
jgi:AMMECR1 domain-containing protein